MEQYIIFNLSDKKFAVKLKYVNEVSEKHEATKIISTPKYVDGICYLKNDVYTIVNLSELFKIPIKPKFPKTILCTYHEANVGLYVEEVIDIIYLPVENTIEDDSSNFMHFIHKIVDYNKEKIYILNLPAIIGYKEEE